MAIPQQSTLGKKTSIPVQRTGSGPVAVPVTLASVWDLYAHKAHFTNRHLKERGLSAQEWNGMTDAQRALLTDCLEVLNCVMNHPVKATRDRYEATKANAFIYKCLRLRNDPAALKQALRGYIADYGIDEKELATRSSFKPLDSIPIVSAPPSAAPVDLCNLQIGFVERLTSPRECLQIREGKFTLSSGLVDAVVEAANFLAWLERSWTIDPGTYIQTFRGFLRARDGVMADAAKMIRKELGDLYSGFGTNASATETFVKGHGKPAPQGPVFRTVC